MDSLSVARSMRGSVGMLAMHWLMCPDRAPFAEARNAVEAAANGLHAPDFDTLTDDERDEFRTLAKAALAHASAKLTPSTAAAPPKD